MITPAFELSQIPNFLTIIIHVPYAKINEVDLYIDGVDFKFYAKPYFLRLTLPGKIVEDGREKASYDADAGIFTIKVPKETPAEYFEGLDMLTALLAPKGSRSAKPLLEEMGHCVNAEIEEEEEWEEFDWEIEQTPYVELEGNVINSCYFYGFGNLRSGVFRRLQHELSDVIDLKEPDSTTMVERRQKRLAAEEAKFDSDHYLADLFEDDTIQHLLKCKPWWTDTQKTKEDAKKTQNEQCDWIEPRRQFGKSAVLKCLLGIHKIFRENDPAYLFNDLYITDYCIWIQKVKSKKLASLAESLQSIKVTKGDLCLELEELEKAALLVQEEENQIKPGESIPQPHQSESETEEDNDSEESSNTSCDTGDSDSCEDDLSNCSNSEEACRKDLCRGTEADYLTEIKVKEALIKLNCAEEAAHMDGIIYPDKCTLGETSTAKSPPRRLIEELADQLQSVELSEHCEKSAVENSGASEHKPTSLTLQSLAQYQHSQTTSQQTFLEVSPKRNCLLLVAGPDNTEDFTNLA
ncbi:protein SHQ1 homolog isoform X2 [Heptranchias perlo]|uniref:protein SHQ1 homolog isoform X2 n=1 Tax=Heptranchias perlo TaxID=212740 RepID=UPI003559531F